VTHIRAGTLSSSTLGWRVRQCRDLSEEVHAGDSFPGQICTSGCAGLKETRPDLIFRVMG